MKARSTVLRPVPGSSAGHEVPVVPPVGGWSLGADDPMQFPPRAAVAALATVGCLIQAPASLAVEHTAPQHPVKHTVKTKPMPKPLKLPADYAAWSRVARCESGGWRVQGAAYPDSLGITRQNYVDFGGQPQTVGWVTRAEIVEQIRVADRLIQHYHVGIPDQGGVCAAW